MKQYTSKDQTAKLIELGFSKPQSILDPYWDCDECFVEYETAYSIGELIEFLPITINWTPRIIMGKAIEYSFGTVETALYYYEAKNELIDNLFDMCVKLKEEGVI